MCDEICSEGDCLCWDCEARVLNNDESMEHYYIIAVAMPSRESAQQLETGACTRQKKTIKLLGAKDKHYVSWYIKTNPQCQIRK